MFESESLALMLLSVDVDDVDAHHGVKFDRWLRAMPPAPKESHPPPGVPNEPEDAEAEESDEYVIADDDDDYAGEDDEEEGEVNGRQGSRNLTALLIGGTAGPGQEEDDNDDDDDDDDDDDEEYSDDAEGDGKERSAPSPVKRGRDGEEDRQEDEGQDAKKVKV